jgi:sugar phosphate isomerase/epimerase
MNVAGGFHLTYCSNIHPGETWSEVSSALATSLPRVRGLLGFEGPFAVGLRLSAQAAEALEAPSALAAFRDFLREGNYYVLTINGFPYGAFHGQRVKEQVYRPDWRNAARLEYANRLARLLAALLSDRPDIEGSVSTVPGAFRANVTGDADVTVMATQMLRHAAALVLLREQTGVTVTLAIEPEPACYIETVDDAIAFFHARLFDAAAVARVARDARVTMTVEDVRRHVGICFDACHMAVEFEEPGGALRRLREAGIRVCKVQISSALRIDREDEAAMRALVPFAEGTYLHQVVERSTSGLTRYVDLPEALAATTIPAAVQSSEWRVHFHVPIFLSAMNSFDTTQADLVAVLDALKRDPVCPYLEVETYTWDVLPAEYRTSDVCTAIARELTWVRAQLEA